jgi:hypothetical protein
MKAQMQGEAVNGSVAIFTVYETMWMRVERYFPFI